MLRSLITLGAGEGISRLLNVTAFMLLTRSVGKEVLGEFGLAVAFTSYFLLVVQQGMDVLAIREVSRSPEQLTRYCSQLFGLRFVLATAVFLAVALYAISMGTSRLSSQLLLVLSLRYFTTAVTPSWAFQAIGYPRALAISGTLSQALFFSAVVLVRRPDQIVWAGVALVGGEAVAAAYLCRALCRVTGPMTPSFDVGFWSHLLRSSGSISLSVLLGNLLYNFDVLALAWFSGKAEIGLYLACYRCTTVFSPILNLLGVTVLPPLSRAYPNATAWRKVGEQVTVPSVLFFSMPAFFLIWFAKPLLGLLYGPSFEEGGKILQVLAWTLPIQASRIVLRQMLIAFKMQNCDVLNMAYAVITNIALDLTLVAHWGALGCAASTLASELVLWMASRMAVRQRTERVTA